MEHIVQFFGGHDCIRFRCKFGERDCKPGADGSHGAHGLSIRFVAKGDAGAVQFLLYTGWLPQFAEPSTINTRDVIDWGHNPMPAELAFHSKTPRYEGQKRIRESCEFCDGQPCYYDGSCLNASDAMYALVNGGGEALWAFLDGYYAHVFDGGDYPVPAEYPTPLRLAVDR